MRVPIYQQLILTTKLFNILFLTELMSIFKRIQTSDAVTKGGIIVLFMMLLYILFLFALKPVFIFENDVLPHTTVMGDHIMSFASPAQRNLNLMALFLSVAAGLGVWLLLKGKQLQPATIQQAPANELQIIKKALSADEKKILEEVERAGEITQDSLRFRLNWSKAKVSALLLQLDRMNLVQRERQGKTYNVFLSKKK